MYLRKPESLIKASDKNVRRTWSWPWDNNVSRTRCNSHSNDQIRWFKISNSICHGNK